MSASNSPDRRRGIVGHRKIGYCGHVPETIFFERPTVVEVSIHPLKTGNVERRVPSVNHDHRASPVEEGCVHLDAEARMKDASHLARLARPSMHSRAPSPLEQHRGPIAGYGGHRMGMHMMCGGAQGETKIQESNREPLLVPKFEPLPRMPLTRGPHRRNPVGFDVFLTD